MIHFNVICMYFLLAVAHVNQYPKIHYFGNPRHTQSMIAYIIILTEYFWKFQRKIALWECYINALLDGLAVWHQFWGVHLPVHEICKLYNSDVFYRLLRRFVQQWNRFSRMTRKGRQVWILWEQSAEQWRVKTSMSVQR